MIAADQDIENRRPVWRALSELFLDTELQDNDFSCIARTLAKSPYTLAEIERILFREVYPVCIPNMLSVAGEWAGFDFEWLEESILRHTKRSRALGSILHPHRWMIRDDWNRVKELYSRRSDDAGGPRG